jgi:hypothetical protein
LRHSAISPIGRLRQEALPIALVPGDHTAIAPRMAAAGLILPG